MFDVSKSLYEFLIGSPNPPSDKPIYWNSVFPSVGFITLIIVITIVILYYVSNRFVFNKLYSSLGGWFLVLVITGIFAFAFAYSSAQIEGATQNTYMLMFAAINTIYSLMLFFISSWFFKYFSIHAKRVPF